MSLKVQLQVLRDNFRLTIDTQIASKGITAIYGPSGCGKTTLLRCIAGLENTNKGKIIFNDEVWLDGENKIPVEQRATGFVFQEASLFPHLNVRQNLCYGMKRSRQGKKPLENNKPGNHLFEFDKLVGLLGLTRLLDQGSHSLSGGERQRVAIARAILSHPGILLMDEPLASLDKTSKQEILPYLEKLHQHLQLPIIYVSHSEEEIAHLADDLLIMDKGKITAQGALLDMLANLNSPLTELDDCFGLIDCIVERTDREFHLAQLNFDGLKLQLPATNLQPGQQVRIRVLAKDISLCLTPPQDSSILNILPAEITGLKSGNNGQCLISLQTGGFNLIARISIFSRQRLKLNVGSRVYAQIKAMALIKPGL